MSRTILITGASSSFGQELISRLPNDVRVIAQSRSPLPKINGKDSQITNVISDFSNPDFLTDFDGGVNFNEIDEIWKSGLHATILRDSFSDKFYARSLFQKNIFLLLS